MRSTATRKVQGVCVFAFYWYSVSKYKYNKYKYLSLWEIQPTHTNNHLYGKTATSIFRKFVQKLGLARALENVHWPDRELPI